MAVFCSTIKNELGNFVNLPTLYQSINLSQLTTCTGKGCLQGPEMYILSLCSEFLS